MRTPAIPLHLRTAIVTLIVLAAGLGAASQTRSAPSPAAAPLCVTVNSPADLKKAGSSDLTTVEQGYRCLLRHYVSGKKLDDRVLLQGAFSGLAAFLRVKGAVLSGLTGDREADWQTFSRIYKTVASKLPGLASVQSVLAEVSLDGMARSLNDDHTAYLPTQFMKLAVAQLSDSGPIPTIGIVTSPITSTAPLFVTDVFPGSPAAQAGVQPGDTITLVGGQTPFSQGQANAGLIALVLPEVGTPVSITVHRPSTGATLTFKLSPRSMVESDTSARIVGKDLAYVKLYSFTEHAANHVFAAIKGLNLGSSLHGVVLDLRGNEGGAADQAVRLISAFTHARTVAYEVDGKGHRAPQRTDDKVALLHVPVTVLIDGGSASSSEIVAQATRDFHLGKLVGTRSAGALAGAEFFGLNDGGGLEITEVHVLGPQGEHVDGTGITPDDQVSTSASDLSAGHDPALDQAVRDLRLSPATP